VVAIAGPVARATPLLQTHIEGASYIGGTDNTWVLSSQASGESFRLWVMGSVPYAWKVGKKIKDVRLYVAFPSSEAGLTISITPALAGGTGEYIWPTNPAIVFDDTSLPGLPTLGETASDGSVPDGLTRHYVYKRHGVTWQEYLLGDFTLSDSLRAHLKGPQLAQLKPNKAQLNAYDVTITRLEGSGTEPIVVHFDVTGWKGNFLRRAPYKYDSRVEVLPPASPNPEPASVVLLALGGACLCLRRVLRR
jgi:hypothetical protein